MFSTSAIGFVFRPSLVQDVIRCAYGRDGNSYNMPDHGCGWEHEPPDRIEAMMRSNEHLQYSGSCLWGAPTIEDRSGCRYNEVVLNGWLYSQRLPRIVEAVFYPINGHVDVARATQDVRATCTLALWPGTACRRKMCHCCPLTCLLRGVGWRRFATVE